MRFSLSYADTTLILFLMDFTCLPTFIHVSFLILPLLISRQIFYFFKPQGEQSWYYVSLYLGFFLAVTSSMQMLSLRSHKLERATCSKSLAFICCYLLTVPEVCANDLFLMTSWQLLMKEYMVSYDFIINFIVLLANPQPPSPFCPVLR